MTFWLAYVVAPILAFLILVLFGKIASLQEDVRSLEICVEDLKIYATRLELRLQDAQDKEPLKIYIPVVD